MRPRWRGTGPEPLEQRVRSRLVPMRERTLSCSLPNASECLGGRIAGAARGPGRIGPQLWEENERPVIRSTQSTGRGWVVWNEPVLTLRGIGFSAIVIPYRGGIAHDNYTPLPNSSIVWSGKETRISSLTAHRGIVTALAARGCAMSCVTFLNENSDELGARSRRLGPSLGPWEMIASMSQGADTYMPPTRRQQRHGGGSLCGKTCPSHGFVEVRSEAGRVQSQDMTCHAARAVPVGSDCRCKSNLSGSDKGYSPGATR